MIRHKFIIMCLLLFITHPGVCASIHNPKFLDCLEAVPDKETAEEMHLLLDKLSKEGLSKSLKSRIFNKLLSINITSSKVVNLKTKSTPIVFFEYFKGVDNNHYPHFFNTKDDLQLFNRFRVKFEGNCHVNGVKINYNPLPANPLLAGFSSSWWWAQDLIKTEGNYTFALIGKILVIDNKKGTTLYSKPLNESVSFKVEFGH